MQPSIARPGQVGASAPAPAAGPGRRRAARAAGQVMPWASSTACSSPEIQPKIRGPSPSACSR